MSQPKVPSCIFCQLFVENSQQQNEAIIEFKDDNLVVIRDKYPKSDLHLLAIPQRHIATTSDISKDNIMILKELERKIVEVAAQTGFNASDSVIGYHKWPFIHVKHLHLHLISPYSKVGYFSRLFFIDKSICFVSSKRLIAELENTIEK